jgi:SAM-dependent methyltransferase
MNTPLNPFSRIDETADENFYSYPRLVVHIDDGAIAKVRDAYHKRIAHGAAILDLMSSWRSHLPEELSPARVTGLGLNRAEMEDNPALTEIVVHNVNTAPRLPFDDASFDAAVMTVSVQYLTHPVEVFADVARVLRPARPFIVTFSNRMFPTKAIALWRAANDEQRVAIVRRYFELSGGFADVEVVSDEDGESAASDPIWVVTGYTKVSA